MSKLGELVRRGPAEVEQQKAATRNVFGEIGTLAPQLGFSDRLINYSSGSLASLIRERETEAYLPELVSLLGLRSSDWVRVYFPRQTVDETPSPNSLWLENGALGKEVRIKFDNRSFALGKITIGDEAEIISSFTGPRFARDQVFLLQTFEAIRDDLLGRRSEWRDSMAEQREDFAERLRALGKSTAVAVDRVLGAISSAFPQGQFSVFGLIEEAIEDDNKPEQEEQKVRLFTTMPLTEEAAKKIHDRTSPLSNYPVKESVYSHRLDRRHISFDSLLSIPRTFGIVPKELTIRFDGRSAQRASLQITVESFYPARITPLSSWDASDHQAFYQPEGNPDEILEQHFSRLLTGRDPKFYPITAVNREATLLLKSPNSTPNGALFDREFLDKPGDFGA
ncbi:MAG: hypothetical protein M1372_01850 [Patescibacteria group bacterium]|nr:hypothetical protein [Patescibacteria group bacterium]